MKIRITSDSTTDLSPATLIERNIAILPLYVTLGQNTFLDGVTLTPDGIYEFYKKEKQLPKTAARSPEDNRVFFAGVLKEGYDAIIHFTISDKLSMTYQNAASAAKEFDNVYVIDGKSLSTGTGLLMLYASDLVEEGKLSAAEIAQKVAARVDSVQASFVVDTLEFLYKGGRCSGLAYVGGSILGIKPCIKLSDGTMGVRKKFMGRLSKVLLRYIDDILETYNNPDKTRCFVTHTKMPEGATEAVIEHIKSKGIFAEILDTTAGATITTHCGEGTLGLLYLLEE
jgi:DegV family protein with EDD domain